MVESSALAVDCCRFGRRCRPDRATAVWRHQCSKSTGVRTCAGARWMKASSFCRLLSVRTSWWSYTRTAAAIRMSNIMHHVHVLIQKQISPTWCVNKTKQTYPKQQTVNPITITKLYICTYMYDTCMKLKQKPWQVIATNGHLLEVLSDEISSVLDEAVVIEIPGKRA